MFSVALMEMSMEMCCGEQREISTLMETLVSLFEIQLNLGACQFSFSNCRYLQEYTFFCTFKFKMNSKGMFALLGPNEPHLCSACL